VRAEIVWNSSHVCMSATPDRRYTPDTHATSILV